nr:hypothetical protein CFP56_48779 [Quercus suber]
MAEIMAENGARRRDVKEQPQLFLWDGLYAYGGSRGTHYRTEKNCLKICESQEGICRTINFYSQVYYLLTARDRNSEQ